jgi:purine-nucleoside phosphorylase
MSVHLEARPGDIAPIVLLPGDPLRAQFIAEKFRADLPTRELVLAQAAATDSAMFRATFNGATFAAAASFDLLQRAHQLATQWGKPVRVGTVLTSDTFYPDESVVTTWWHPWAEHDVLAAEMETAALYTLAARRRARALSILTVSDNLITGEQTTSEERQTGFGDMAQLALALVADERSSLRGS